jgi:hypothetical protein
MSSRFCQWLSCGSAAVVVMCMLGFYSTSGAAPQGGQPPFANSVEQRDQMIRELRDIKELLKEQNTLLRESLKPAHDPLKR